jgi:hypothetical protein
LNISFTGYSPTVLYDDVFRRDGILRYRYRGSDPAHRDNVGLRKLMSERIPLIYFRPLNRTIGVVEVWEDLLEEHDGPMLEHGLQKLQGIRSI